MTADDKPREFWVLAAYEKVPGDQGACFETEQAGLTHVIEKSAYDRVCAELSERPTNEWLAAVIAEADRIKAERDDFESAYEIVCERELRITKERDQLRADWQSAVDTIGLMKAEIEKLRSALKKLESGVESK